MQLTTTKYMVVQKKRATVADKNAYVEVDDKEEAVKTAAVRVFLKLKYGVTVLRVR